MNRWKCITAITIVAMNTITGSFTNPRIDTMNNLVLQIEPFPEKVPLRKPIEVKVRLVNEGTERVLVNSRMAVGYENSLSRELYLQLERVDRPEDLAYIEYDINREFSPPGDYRWLKPGEAVTASFDLLDYYHITKPGTYRLTLFYQADEELADPPEEIYTATVRSEPVTVHIVSDQGDANEN